MRLTSLVLFLTCLAPAAAAQGTRSRPLAPSQQDRTEAQTTYRKALEAYDARQYREALSGFVRAYELAPSFRIQYNIAMVHVLLEDHAAALIAFERYLKEGGALVPPKRVEEVEEQIARVSKYVGTLEVETDVPAARVFVDDVEVGTTPLPAPLRLNQGKHRVTLLGGDSEPHNESIVIVAGKTRTLRVKLSAPEPADSGNTVASTPVNEAEESREEKRSVPWAAWAITGALGVGAVTTGALALGARSDEKSEQQREGVSTADLDDARSKVKTLSLATDVLLGATAIAAGVSLYLTFGRSETSSETSTAIVVSPGHVRARLTF